MIQKLMNTIFYAGTNKEGWQHVKGRIEAANRFALMAFSSLAFVLVSTMMILSFFQEGFSKSQPIYLGGMIFSVVLFLLSLFANRYPDLTYIGVYLAASVFFLYGIAIGIITRPEEQTVTFMVLLLFIPLIFIDRPIRMGGCLLFYICLFLIGVIQVKTGSVRSVDITDAIIFGFMAIVSGTIVIRTKVRGYILERRLQIMSETDQLTGLNNRNCYEWRLESYPGMCQKNLCCIYIDVNGLHSLNNTKGHKEGDAMLRFIAQEVQEEFGFRDTYRIGGDEYVAFVTDTEEDYIIHKLEGFTARVKAEHYHVAIGYEIQSVEELNMTDLIVAAESKMYQDKSEYYRRHDRRAR